MFNTKKTLALQPFPSYSPHSSCLTGLRGGLLGLAGVLDCRPMRKVVLQLAASPKKTRFPPFKGWMHQNEPTGRFQIWFLFHFMCPSCWKTLKYVQSQHAPHPASSDWDPASMVKMACSANVRICNCTKTWMIRLFVINCNMYFFIWLEGWTQTFSNLFTTYHLRRLESLLGDLGKVGDRLVGLPGLLRPEQIFGDRQVKQTLPGTKNVKMWTSSNWNNHFEKISR